MKWADRGAIEAQRKNNAKQNRSAPHERVRLASNIYVPPLESVRLLTAQSPALRSIFSLTESQAENISDRKPNRVHASMGGALEVLSFGIVYSIHLILKHMKHIW